MSPGSKELFYTGSTLAVVLALAYLYNLSNEPTPTLACNDLANPPKADYYKFAHEFLNIADSSRLNFAKIPIIPPRDNCTFIHTQNENASDGTKLSILTVTGEKSDDIVPIEIICNSLSEFYANNAIPPERLAECRDFLQSAKIDTIIDNQIRPIQINALPNQAILHVTNSGGILLPIGNSQIELPRDLVEDSIKKHLLNNSPSTEIATITDTVGINTGEHSAEVTNKLHDLPSPTPTETPVPVQPTATIEQVAPTQTIQEINETTLAQKNITESFQPIPQKLTVFINNPSKILGFKIDRPQYLAQELNNILRDPNVSKQAKLDVIYKLKIEANDLFHDIKVKYPVLSGNKRPEASKHRFTLENGDALITLEDAVIIDESSTHFIIGKLPNSNAIHILQLSTKQMEQIASFQVTDSAGQINSVASETLEKIINWDNHPFRNANGRGDIFFTFDFYATSLNEIINNMNDGSLQDLAITIQQLHGSTAPILVRNSAGLTTFNLPIGTRATSFTELVMIGSEQYIKTTILTEDVHAITKSNNELNTTITNQIINTFGEGAISFEAYIPLRNCVVKDIYKPKNITNTVTPTPYITPTFSTSSGSPDALNTIVAQASIPTITNRSHKPRRSTNTGYSKNWHKLQSYRLANRTA